MERKQLIQEIEDHLTTLNPIEAANFMEEVGRCFTRGIKSHAKAVVKSTATGFIEDMINQL